MPYSEHDAGYREHVKLTEDSGARSVLDKFSANDVDDTGPPITYIGQEDTKGFWIIRQIDETSGIAIRWASILNNPTKTTYSAAWTDRATLTYGNYSDVIT